MARCARCDHDYPEDILHPLVGSMWTDPICAICAREVRKILLGMDVPFRADTIAAECERRAIEHRAKEN